VGAEIGPAQLRGPVAGQHVRALVTELFGDGHPELVSPFTDTDDYVVAGVDARTPVDEYRRVLSNAVIHAVRSVSQSKSALTLAQVVAARLGIVVILEQAQYYGLQAVDTRRQLVLQATETSNQISTANVSVTGTPTLKQESSEKQSDFHFPPVAACPPHAIRQPSLSEPVW
jgi:hypothetical protein